MRRRDKSRFTYARLHHQYASYSALREPIDERDNSALGITHSYALNNVEEGQ